MRRRARLWTVLGFLGALVLLTGCGTGGESEADLDLAGTWQLTEGSGPSGAIEPSADSPITLTFDGDAVTGSDGCNSLTGTVKVAGSRVVLDQLAVTERACLDESVMAAASAFHASLGEVTGGAREGEVLVLLGDQTDLRFAKE